MKFQVLGDKTVVEAGVTDHNVVIDGAYATFNLLVQCANYDYYYNNGFKIVETDAQYADRLFNKTIPVLKEMYDNGVRIFMLQEAPALIHLHQDHATTRELAHYVIADEFYARLQEAIPQLDIKGAVYSKEWGALDSGGLLTLVDHTLSEHIVNTTLEMKSAVSEGNQTRFQSFELHFEGDHAPIKIANFHADFATQEGTKADIMHFVQDHYVIGGDFNLIDLPLSCDTVHSVSEITVPGMMLTDTYDAIFFGDEAAHSLPIDTLWVSPLSFSLPPTLALEGVFDSEAYISEMMYPVSAVMYLDHFDHLFLEGC